MGHQFRVEGFASYTKLNFRNPSSFPNLVISGVPYKLSSKNRDDDLLRADLVVDRPISDNTSLSARYTYFNSISNADSFDYQRHVVGLYVTIRFAP